MPQPRHNAFTLGATLAIALLLAACSGGPVERDDGTISPPSTGQVQQMMQAYFDAHPQCAPFFDLPHDVRVDSDAGRTLPQAFVEAGLLTAEEPTAPVDDLRTPTQSVRYVATQEGAKAIHAGTGIYQPYPSVICYGTRKVDSVTIGEPDNFGVDVQYRYHFADVPAWANHRSIQQAYPLLAQWLSTPQESSVKFVVKDGKLVMDEPEGIEMFDFVQRGL